MSPSDIESQSDKKTKKILLFLGVFDALVIIVTAIIAIPAFVSKSAGNDSDEVDVGNVQKFFNTEEAPTDTLSIFMSDKDDPELNIFFGFKLDHISEDLEFIPYASIKNNYMRIISYGANGIDLEYSGRKFYYISGSNYLIYRPETGSKKASINTDEIVYNSGDYYVTYDGFTKDYEAYYKYGTTTNVSMEMKAGEEGWKLIKFDTYDTKEEAIERVTKLSSTSEICFYTNSEGISKCKNVNKYNNLNDIILKKLADVGIHVRSYKYIDSFDFGQLNIINNARDVGFGIGGMTLGAPVSDSRYTSFEINGKKYYTDYSGQKDYYGLQGGIYLPEEGSETKVIGFRVDTADGTSKSRDDIIKEFKKTFGE